MCTALSGLESMLGKAGPVSLSVGDGDRRLQARTDLRRKLIVLTGTTVESKLKRFFKHEGARVPVCQKQ